MKYTSIAFLCFILLCTCNYKKIHISNKSFNSRIEKNKLNNSYLCNWSEFDTILDCSDYYDNCCQFTLYKDYFKPTEIITIYFDNNIDCKNIFRTTVQISFHPYEEYKRLYEGYKILIIEVDTIYFFYNRPIKIDVHKINYEINQSIKYFNDSIWRFKEENWEDYIDPELWIVQFRKDMKYHQVIRASFHDTLYYKAIQDVIAKCGVHEYEFK